MGIAIPGTVKDGIVVKSVNLGLKNYDIVKNIQSKIYYSGESKCLKKLQ